MSEIVVRWGGLWKDRSSEHLLCEDCLPVLFRTRREARMWIEQKYGYIRKRKDLRVAPHYWRLPTAVKVTLEVKSE